jgi:predicted DNA-binding transcriptional regulator YafY
MNQNRIFRVIKLMEYLQIKPRPIYAMVRYLQISERSVYRYLKMYEKLGYKINKDKYGKYSLTKITL